MHVYSAGTLLLLVLINVSTYTFQEKKRHLLTLQKAGHIDRE